MCAYAFGIVARATVLACAVVGKATTTVCWGAVANDKVIANARLSIAATNLP